jgi:hypothetical protein
MSASAPGMHEWIDTFRDSAQLEQIHPSAQCIFGEIMAIEAGDMTEFARLLRLTQDKIADELEWEEDKLCSADDPH